MPSLTAALAAADRQAAWPLPSRVAAGAGPAKAAIAGNAARTDELLLAQQPRIRRLVHRLLGWSARAAEVDDVVQEVFLAAWKHRATFRGDAQLATWLVRIALRKAHAHERSRRVRRRLAALLGGAVEAVAAPRAPCAVEADDDVRALRTAMTVLPHRDREVLVLRCLEARPAAEVAAALGCSRAAVDQRLLRARAKLRALLEGVRP